eukprot:Colp12_sorted_trinity150504_noHs@27657
MADNNNLPLSAAIVRGLNDKLYDKRKVAALEVERLVKELFLNNETPKIEKIVASIKNDFAFSSNPNSRKGGLIGLAATAIALGQPGIGPFLNELVPPVLGCFLDQDSRVRYYSCEAMYN